MIMNEDYLLLKWGTVKGWDFPDVESDTFGLLKEYLKDSPASCITDHPDEDRKNLLCKIIDMHDGVIENDWEGKVMSKAEAKNYVQNY